MCVCISHLSRPIFITNLYNYDLILQLKYLHSELKLLPKYKLDFFACFIKLQLYQPC